VLLLVKRQVEEVNIMNIVASALNPVRSSVRVEHVSPQSKDCVKLSLENDEKVLDVTVDTDDSMTDGDSASSSTAEDYEEDIEVEEQIDEDYEAHQGDTIAKALFEGLSIASAKAVDQKLSAEVNCMLLYIAAMYRDRNKFGKSVEYFEEALSMARNRLGKDHVDIGRILVNIGRVRVRQEKLEDAIKCFMDALNIFETEENRIIVGNRHIDMTLRIYKRVSLDLSEKLRAEQLDT